MNEKRCTWATTELSIAYHDAEWGRPVHDDRIFFEFLTLEGAQAGLSWETILRKRDRYREVFFGFDPARVAKMNRANLQTLMNDEGIIRNRSKLESTLSNAKAFLEVQREFGSFDAYVWRFVDGKPIVNAPVTRDELQGESAESLALSKDLRKRGFRFVGPTIMYAFMQATGMVNDHLADCGWRNRKAGRR